MAFDKLSLLRVFSLTCNYGKKVYYRNLLNELGRIEGNFSKPSVRLRTNVWDSYNCLIRLAEIPLEEDLSLFRYQRLTISTKSSEGALKLMESLIEGERFKKETYFKSRDYLKPTELINWYSNLYSFQKFYEHGVTIVGLWCSLNPKDEDGFSQDKVVPLINQVLLDFLSSREFKIVLTDLINISRFNLEKNIGLFNDKEKETN